MINCFAPVEYYGKISQNIYRQAVGCNLVVLKIVLRQLHCKIQAPSPATPYEQFNSVLDLDSTFYRQDAMRVILF
jgi:hypothetical protein